MTDSGVGHGRSARLLGGGFAAVAVIAGLAYAATTAPGEVWRTEAQSVSSITGGHDADAVLRKGDRQASLTFRSEDATVAVENELQTPVVYVVYRYRGGWTRIAERTSSAPVIHRPVPVSRGERLRLELCSDDALRHCAIAFGVA
ncbi:hypothetical protein [Mumia sp. Pv 4-285]|uniref:hypothetical protein n=1 Tax=Mumia qirimensis TaxID=3234852 RepID=UPI00351CD39F